MSNRKPMASVSLDVDNLWSYMKTHGDEGWRSRPSYLDLFIPHVLRALERLDLKITFFIVGVDAARETNRSALQSIVDAGHEVGNHSHEHEPWLHLYDPDRLEREITESETAIEEATGSRPVGFRGPGFSWSPALLQILSRKGYLFDASTLPTYIGPLARMYYFWSAKLSPEEREKRKELFGRFKDGLGPTGAYNWKLEDGKTILEIPVTTIPVVKTPFHLSYLLYLSRFSRSLMTAYLQTAMSACKITGTEPSFLLHPLDLLGGDQVPQLSFFPGMDIRGVEKIELFLDILRKMGDRFDLVPMGTHARALLARPALRERRVTAERG